MCLKQKAPPPGIGHPYLDTWSESARKYKLERSKDPLERPHRKRKSPQIRPTRKHLLDRLNHARKDLIDEAEWREAHRDSIGVWGVSLFEYYRKRYVLALQACMDAGLDIVA